MTETLTLNLWQRLINVSNEVDALQKDTTVGEGRFKYKGISHDSVIRSCKGALAKYGVLALASVVEHEEHVLESVDKGGNPRFQHKSEYTVRTLFINADAPEEREEVFTRGIGIDSLDKSAGKAQSYAKKYALMMALQMFTADGDETRDDAPHGRPATKKKSSGKKAPLGPSDTVTGGKHEGKTVQEVIDTEPDYFVWWEGKFGRSRFTDEVWDLLAQKTKSAEAALPFDD